MACPKIPAQTIAELVALAKARQMSIGSSGFGSNHHLAAEMLKTAAGISLTHVPYKGFGNAVVDAVGCNVDLLFGSIPAGIPHITSGKLRALAVTQPHRHAGLPDTPTFAEAGYPSVAMDAYFGMLAPAGTPQPIIGRLYTEIAAILQEKETRERLSGAGLDIVGSTPDQFKDRLRSDLAKYAAVARSLGAKAE
jgi:tripartite-type tricarboxylate transporter receptor subunit TctC